VIWAQRRSRVSSIERARRQRKMNAEDAQGTAEDAEEQWSFALSA
jgi:hypothetical protein